MAIITSLHLVACLWPFFRSPLHSWKFRPKYFWSRHVFILWRNAKTKLAEIPIFKNIFRFFCCVPGTVILRIVIFPVMLKARKAMIHNANMMPQITRAHEKMKEASASNDMLASKYISSWFVARS